MTMFKRIFISYSWDSSAHREWVRKLADSLEEHTDLHVVWDGYDLDALADKNKFMESGIADSQFIIVIATKNFKNKADARTGGVGIETYLSTAAHWESLQNEGKTKVIVVQRELDSIPNYMKGHLYVDFTADSQYPESEATLLKHIRGSHLIPRPNKRRDSHSDENLYTFTRVEELIRVGHANRKPVVSGDQGTDFSAGKRIRYELWETRSPAITYFLALAQNINITQTVNHAIEKLKEQSLNPTDLTVLRPRPPRAEQNLIAEVFITSGYKTRIYEYTYKNYIWDFCIDETLKSIYPPSEIPNYTHQSLSYFDESGNSLSVPSARDFLVEELQKSSNISAHLVVASGGMGKTSLCLAVATKLHNRSDLHSSVVLIQAESIKRYVAENGIATTRIDSIFQLYELYARSQEFELTFDRNVFELGFLSGNLIVIIDGLDEFVSLFPDAFSLDDFLNSLIKFHKELGSSSVLLTTRNSHLLDVAQLSELCIQRYELLGFDRNTCETYLSRRFRKYSEGVTIANRVLAKIDKVQLRDNDGRVVPFFADIAATVAEDGLCDNSSEELEIGEEPTPYHSNNDLTDHIIHSVIKREQLRHDLDLSVIDIVQLLSGLVADFSRGWLFSAMLTRLMLLYDERAQGLAAKIAKMCSCTFAISRY